MVRKVSICCQKNITISAAWGVLCIQPKKDTYPLWLTCEWTNFPHMTSRENMMTFKTTKSQPRLDAVAGWTITCLKIKGWSSAGWEKKTFVGLRWWFCSLRLTRFWVSHWGSNFLSQSGSATSRCCWGSCIAKFTSSQIVYMKLHNE